MTRPFYGRNRASAQGRAGGNRCDCAGL